MKALDYKALGKEITGVLTESLSGVVEGAEGDVHVFAQDIAQDMVLAAALGRKERMETDLPQQARLLIEFHRLKVTNESWKIMDRILKITFRVLLAALAAVTATV